MLEILVRRGQGTLFREVSANPAEATVRMGPLSVKERGLWFPLCNKCSCVQGFNSENGVPAAAQCVICLREQRCGCCKYLPSSVCHVQLQARNNACSVTGPGAHPSQDQTERPQL